MLNKIVNTAYSVGAAIVVFGAWGKIEHKSFGDAALTAGLLTEVLLFLVYGIMEWKKESEEKINIPVVGSEDTGELTNAMKGVSSALTKIFRI